MPLTIVSNVDGQLDAFDIVLLRESGEQIAATHYGPASIARWWGTKLSAHQPLLVREGFIVQLSTSECRELIVRVTVGFVPDHGQRMEASLGVPLGGAT